MTGLQSRLKEPELMDDPSLDAAAHAQALRGLARINRWSASSRIVWSPLLEWMRRHGRRSARVLDVATGAGDMPLALWRRATRAGMDLRIEGCDTSAQAVAHAQANARKAGADVRFFVVNAVTGVPAGYDVVMCSLFLHHLEEDEAVRVMRDMGRAAGGLVLVNDLARSRRGLALAYAGTRLLSRSPVVHADGPRSVRAAFTPQEARRLAEQAGWTGAIVERKWPCRFLIAWHAS